MVAAAMLLTLAWGAATPIPARAGGEVIVAVATPGGAEVPRAGSDATVVTLVLVMGADPGSVCFEMRDLNLQEAGQNGTYHVEISTAPPPAPDLPPSTIVAELGSLAIPESVNTGCVAGLDDAVVADLFSNPSSYHVNVYFSDALLGGRYSVLGAWLGAPGEQCVIRAHPPNGVVLTPLTEVATGPYVYEELPVQVWGFGFLTDDSVDLIMAPLSDPSAVQRFALAVDELGRIDMVIAPPHGFSPERWLFSVPESQCAGPAWPAAAAPTPGTSSGAAPSAGGGLPDTALVRRGTGELTVLAMALGLVSVWVVGVGTRAGRRARD